MSEDKTRHPWLKRPEESTEAYQAFTIYLLLPMSSRSLDEAYTVFKAYQGGIKEDKRANGQWRKNSVAYQWVERAKAYDEHLLTQMVIRNQESAILEAQAKVKARKAQAEIEQALAQKYLKQLEFMLSWPIEEKEVTQTDKDGRAVRVTLKPVKWTFGNLAQGLEAWSKLSRLSQDLPTDKTEVDINLVLNDAVKYLMNVARGTLDDENYNRLSEGLKLKN
jgi:hypothetical protein